jgi:hypothetical protein
MQQEKLMLEKIMGIKTTISKTEKRRTTWTNFEVF